jgi:hypothetical protein
MKPNITLMTMSLVTVLLLLLHLADDIVRGFEPGKLSTIYGILIAEVWVYATVMLTDRRTGLVIVLVLSILGCGVPVIHMTGAGMVGGRVAHTSGMLLWVFTLLALGVTTMFSAILAAHQLWNFRRGLTQ